MLKCSLDGKGGVASASPCPPVSDLAAFFPTPSLGTGGALRLRKKPRFFKLCRAVGIGMASEKGFEAIGVGAATIPPIVVLEAALSTFSLAVAASSGAEFFLRNF